MKITVIGTGYVGLVTGTCLADLGHDVTCVDIDAQKIAQLNKGDIPIYERGLEDMLRRNASEGRLSFTTNGKKAIASATIVFSAVGTPMDEDHRADLRYVKQVAKDFGMSMTDHATLVIKSTVPVGTTDMCAQLVKKELQKRNKKYSFDVVTNPEFLREGTAIKDTLNPDRIVVGISNERSRAVMTELYYPITRVGVPLLVTTPRNAEIIKYAANAFLATKISFINEIANFCERAGGDVQAVAKGIGMDKRIGTRFLHAGIGYGGSCFPKDVQAFIQTGKEYDFEFNIIRATEAVNIRQKYVVVDKLKRHIPHLEGKTIAIWGLSFKPHTDDIREATSLYVINALRGAGAQIQAFDPAAMKNAKALFKSSVSYHNTNYDALKGADALLVLTEWPEFVGADLARMRKLMKGKVIIDGRNIYDPTLVQKAGFIYEGIGKPLAKKRKVLKKKTA